LSQKNFQGNGGPLYANNNVVLIAITSVDQELSDGYICTSRKRGSLVKEVGKEMLGVLKDDAVDDGCISIVI
jgi:hypothetical protein